MSDSLVQVLDRVLGGPNTPTTKSQFIGNFGSFIRDHIPYGQVRDRDLQTGLIHFDGPLADGVLGQKPVLVWHFGGVPYPVAKAAIIDYTYVRSWDGSGAYTSASILFGFQSRAAAEIASDPTAARAWQQAASTHVTDAHAPRAAFGQLNAAVTALANSMPSSIVTGSQGYDNLDTFLRTEILSILSQNAATPAAARAQAATSVAEAHGWPRDDGAGNAVPLTIEFDGPARDNNSHRVFAYMFETLVNNREIFGQILWWYFGGQAWRITKAMRIPLGGEGNPSLFVGFTGPGPYP